MLFYSALAGIKIYKSQKREYKPFYRLGRYNYVALNAVSEHRLAACAVAADNIYSGWQLDCCCVAAVNQPSCQVVYD